MGRGGLKAYLRDVYDSVFATVSVAIWAITTFLTTVAGPFDTYGTFPWPIRLVFWGLLIGGSIIVGFLVRFAFKRRVWDRVDWTWEALTSIVFTAIYLPITLLVVHLFAGPDDPIPPVWLIAGSIILVFWTVALIRHYLGYEDPPAPAAPRLAKRLNGAFSAPIARLSVDDHYVEVFLADGGYERILMRFKDAVNEMDHVDGFCVHRSHWVARASVLGVERVNGREFVKLQSGTTVPVGKKYRPNLEAAGLV